MLYTIELINEVANQSFFVKLNGHTVFFRFSAFREMMYADVEIDGVQVVGGSRVLPYRYILPKMYEDIVGGNFLFFTRGGEYVDYNGFNGVDSVMTFEGDAGEDNE